MSRDLDEQCAAALGLARDKWRSECYVNNHSFDDYGYDPTDDTESGWCYTCGVGVCDRVADGHVAPPRFSDDPATTRILLNEIAKRDLREAYCRALAFLFYHVGLRDYTWAIINAEPEHHAKAFLSAMLASGAYKPQ